MGGLPSDVYTLASKHLLGVRLLHIAPVGRLRPPFFIYKNVKDTADADYMDQYIANLVYYLARHGTLRTHEKNFLA